MYVCRLGTVAMRSQCHLCPPPPQRDALFCSCSFAFSLWFVPFRQLCTTLAGLKMTSAEHLEDELLAEDDGINRFGAIESSTDLENLLTLNCNNEAEEVSAAQLYAVRENDLLDWNGYETDVISLVYDSSENEKMEIK